MSLRDLKLGLIGGGAIATGLLELLARAGGVAELTVLLRGGACSPRAKDLSEYLPQAARQHAIVEDPAVLIERSTIIVEAAGHAALGAHAPAILAAGRTLVAVSSGALADARFQGDLIGLCERHGGRLIIPSGAIGGIDMLGAMVEGDPDLDVSYTGTKPPQAWLSAADVDAELLMSLTVAHTLFGGSAREAAIRFPQNANVAATVALAVGGFDRVRVRLVADPAARGNRHRLDVAGTAGRFTFEVEAMASSGKPGTSQTTAQSIMRSLRNLTSPLAV